MVLRKVGYNRHFSVKTFNLIVLVRMKAKVATGTTMFYSALQLYEVEKISKLVDELPTSLKLAVRPNLGIN